MNQLTNKTKLIFTLLVTAFSGLTLADGPDWTPVLKSFEKACSTTEKSTFGILWKNLVVPSNDGYESRLGKVVLPQAYLKATGKPKRENKGEYANYVIPVTSGTYYGMPVKAIELYLGHGNGINGEAIILNVPYSEAKKKLKNVKFEKEPFDPTDGYLQAEILREGKKMTRIQCDSST